MIWNRLGLSDVTTYVLLLISGGKGSQDESRHGEETYGQGLPGEGTIS